MPVARTTVTLLAKDDQREVDLMDIRSLGGVLDSVLSITITLTCVWGAFVVSRFALSVVFR